MVRRFLGVNEQCGRHVTVLHSLAGRALLIDWDGIQLGSGASVQVRGERVDLMRGRGDSDLHTVWSRIMKGGCRLVRSASSAQRSSQGGGRRGL
jgi:hypothetical protein